MATCNKCGAQIPDNSSVCPSCGAANIIVGNINGGDFSGQFSQADIDQNKVMAVLAYFGILFLVPLLAAPQSPYARFHANQGIVLFITDIVLGIVVGVCALIPVAGLIISGVVSLCILVLVILGIINAATGKAKELPLIGKIRIIK